MTLEEAIKTAIEYETKVRNAYRDAEKKVSDPTGKRIYKVLAEEEQGHLDYLNDRLKEWRESGKVDVKELKTLLPTREAVEQAATKVEGALEGKDSQAEMDLLSKALKLETETSTFYRKLLSELPEGERDLFEGFAAIEESHLAIVQAEMDHMSNNGVYFDFMEFDL